MKYRNSLFFKFVAIFIVVNISINIFIPTISIALTSGPSSPEFSGFTPVSSSDMVDLFTGDFNYNIPVIEVPGPHGSGYALSLSYNSGSTSETEASWVGFGWKLNPGAINRNVRGFPDEYNNKRIKYYNKNRPNWTATASTMVGFELMSMDSNEKLGNGNISVLQRINNYTGYQNVTGFGMNYKGTVGFNASYDENGITFNPYVSSLGIFRKALIRASLSNNNLIQYFGDCGRFTKNGRLGFGTNFSGISFDVDNYQLKIMPPSPKPYNYPQYNGFSFNWSTSIQVNPGPLNAGTEIGNQGSFNYRYNVPAFSADAYGYTETPSDINNAIMDYYVEKDNPFDRHDLFLGIPFSNYDIFSVSGEGITGGFRAYKPSIGHYYPRNGISKTISGELGFEVGLGSSIGVGIDFGLGYQQTSVDTWGQQSLNSGTPIYRFTNDLGGQVVYGNNELERAQIELISKVPGFKRAANDAIENYDIQDGHETSAYIDVTKNSDSLISLVEVCNTSGTRYIYGQPSFVKNQTALSVDVHAKKYFGVQDEVKERYLAFKNVMLKKNGEEFELDHEDNHYTALGQIDPNKYANSYLLTEIYSPNYIDADNIEGASNEDFGGWTKFGYRKAYGEGKDKWYRYRMPYNGLLYQQNAISDIKDDLGSVSTGEKEVMYLDSIETKTHIAYFITNKTEHSGNPLLTGSNTSRFDGIGAKELTSTSDPAASLEDNDAFGDTELEFLEKIVLFAKNGEGNIEGQTPLKTINFEYDYRLVPNVANNLNSGFNYANDGNGITQEPNSTGKLTLLKMWVEYQGIVPAMISPYVFNYSYQKPDEDSKLATYFSEQSGYSKLFPDVIQNPPYAPYSLDPWGNISPNGATRRNNGIPWIDQSAFLESRVYGIDDEGQAFDPAAYQLKSIQLPSGGTIHIQYETDDYAFVQNRNAMSMARVKVADGGGPSYGEDDYIINVEDLGCNPTDADAVDFLIDKINNHFQGENVENEVVYGKKVYYKFLFALMGSSPNLDNSNSEYITGYANFKEAVREDIGGGKYGIRITLGSEGTSEGERALVPRQACFEFVTNQRKGKITEGDCVEPIFEQIWDKALADISDDEDISGVLKYLIGLPIMAQMAASQAILMTSYAGFTPRDPRIGRAIHSDLSFLKLPVCRDKVGGGIRVKRLLFHDSGIETGDEVLTGSNFRYVLEDEITSSGVASNEPELAREENPLVGFIPKKGQKFWDRLIAGKVLEQTEGPLGETILPAPFVGYRRVVVENIHTGKSGNGFNIHEYFTTYDYPFDKLYEAQDDLAKYDFLGQANQKTELNEKRDNLKLFGVFFNYISAKSWATQGFRFIQNNMNGQPKKIATYGGSYLDKGSSFLSSYQEYEYYEPGENVKLLELDGNNNLVSVDRFPGKEMEIVRESKQVKDVSLEFDIEFDINYTPPAFFIGNVFPSFSYTENLLSTHTTTKVISYPAIVKSVTNMADGISSKSEFLAFEDATGDPIIVRNSDSFSGALVPGQSGNMNGSTYELNIPAHWMIANMGPKSISENNTNQLSAKAASFTIYENEPTGAWLNNPENVINATIQTYGNSWGSQIASDSKTVNNYPLVASASGELNNIWMPKASYVYKADQLISDGKIYESGYFDGASSWNNPDANSNWIKSSEVVKYSPNGEVLEEIDALNITSAALYGAQYGNNVPVMVASNSDNNSILFRDFEGSDIVGLPAHSGNKSALISTIGNLLEGVYIDKTLKEQGGICKAWIHFDDNQQHALQMQFSLIGASGSIELPMNQVAQVGEWILYEVTLLPEFFSNCPDSGTLCQISANIETSDGGAVDDIYVDDLRFQPALANSTCFVYDVNDLKLLTEFDDQHFGIFYQYNEEGKLVRKVLETERGRKTLKEVNYNMYKQSRN